jgi:hypothetical protein
MSSVSEKIESVSEWILYGAKKTVFVTEKIYSATESIFSVAKKMDSAAKFSDFVAETIGDATEFLHRSVLREVPGRMKGQLPRHTTPWRLPETISQRPSPLRG